MLINCPTLSETMGYMRRQDCLGANSQYVKRKQVAPVGLMCVIYCDGALLFWFGADFRQYWWIWISMGLVGVAVTHPAAQARLMEWAPVTWAKKPEGLFLIFPGEWTSMDITMHSCYAAVRDITRRQALSGTAADTNRMQIALIDRHWAYMLYSLQSCNCNCQWWLF